MPLATVTLPMIETLAICVGALALFVWNRLPFEVVGVLVLVTLVLLGVLPPADAISGFANEATVTVAGMLFLSAALERTGAVDAIGRLIWRLGAGSERRLLFALIAAVVPTSAILNNTAVVAVLLPVVLGLCRRHGFAPSRLLMPLSFAAQLGGILTLVGTSTNLLVAGLLVDFDQPHLGLLSITPPAAVVTAVGILYLATVGRRLLPRRGLEDDQSQSTPFNQFDSALVVQQGSPLIGRSARQARLQERLGLEVSGVRRPGGEPMRLDTPLLAGDVLLVSGLSSALRAADGALGLSIARGRPANGGQRLTLMEAVVPARSRLIGRRAQSIGPITWFGAVAVAIQCHGRCTDRPLERVRLAPGDLLILEGTRAALLRLQRTGMVLLVSRIPRPAPRGKKRWLAMGILLAVVAVSAVGLIPILISALAGSILLVLTGCIHPAQAYEQMDWAVLILIGSLIPLGLAMQRTGAAQLLATLVLDATSHLGPYIVLGALYLLTTILTELISNAATAVLLTPVAISIAATLDVSPLPFAVGVMFAASNSFITPIGYQTNTFVFTPGRYRFTDYARVGAPLCLLLLPIAVLVIPIFFPFRG